MSDLSFVSKIRRLLQFHKRSTLLIFILGLASTQSVAAATIIVPPGGNFQASINAATFGYTNDLHAGGTYKHEKWFEKVQRFLKEFFDIVDYLFVRAFLVILAVMGAVSLIRHHKSKMQL
ncbi:MAG TPA: hypothetical protein VFM05_12290 [Candidatus Saccharimonadales bacterium]|nr:hypothetical protein [Candidatus Saccharimonadales bacterium]